METVGRTVSVPQAAGVLGLGVHAVYRAVQEGRLPVLRSGRKVRVPLAVLERVLHNPEEFSPGQAGEVKR